MSSNTASQDRFATGASKTDGVYCPACVAFDVEEVIELEREFGVHRISYRYDLHNPADEPVTTLPADKARQAWRSGMQQTYRMYKHASSEWQEKLFGRFAAQWAVADRLGWVSADDKPSELFGDA